MPEIGHVEWTEPFVRLVNVSLMGHLTRGVRVAEGLLNQGTLAGSGKQLFSVYLAIFGPILAIWVQINALSPPDWKPWELLGPVKSLFPGPGYPGLKAIIDPFGQN